MTVVKMYRMHVVVCLSSCWIVFAMLVVAKSKMAHEIVVLYEGVKMWWHNMVVWIVR